jgi:PAS domain S-box-containing protein
MRAKASAAIAAVVGWLRHLVGTGLAAGAPAREPPLVPGRSPIPEGLSGFGLARGAGLEQLWAEAAQQSSQGIAIIDPSSATLRAVNVAYAQLLGRTPGQLAGQPSSAAYPASEHVQLLVAEHAADLNGAATLRTRQSHRDGSSIPVEVTLVAVREGNGPVSYRIQTVTDLRPRLGAGGEPRGGEPQQAAVARFRQLAESAPVGILLMEADGAVSYVNPCWTEIAEMPLEQARADGWRSAISPDDRERVADAWEKLRHGVPFDLTFRYRRAGGELRAVHSRGAVLSDEAGAVAGFMAVDADVTEEVRQRAALDAFHGRIRALAHRLERQYEDARGAFAQRLHGALRQDLTTLKGEIDALCARAAAPAALAELAGRCLEELRHIGFEMQPPGVAELGLAEALQRRADECAAASGLRVELTHAGGLPELGARGSLALYRTFEEALSNVVRHARAREVEAHVWVQEGAVHLRVSDDGVGIGDRDRGKAGCFGLLAAAERLTQLGGALRVFGVPGRGTTLDASVPAGPGKERRASAAR